ncbi:MAG: dihydrolipoyl dehydrogenase [Candidatus Omnitrophota bacterium]|jgi:dihydrolipoamide dehydrogenase
MKEFDVCIIGAGPGGTSAAIESSALGARTALIEKDEVGGICLNKGCIPTKARLRSASLYDEGKHWLEFGLNAKDPVSDLQAIGRRSTEVVGRLRDQLDQSIRSKKIELLKGEASFVSEDTVSVNGEAAVRSKSFVIATGSSPRPLAGVKSDRRRVFYSEEILGLEKLPFDMTIIGAGPIGCEFASFFSALGTKVTLIETMDRILPKEDKDISNRLEGIFRKKGIEVVTGAASVDISGMNSEAILISVGRIPNTGRLCLEKAGVSVKDGRIAVDEYLRTSSGRIFSAGDCVGRYNLAHAASAEGRVAAMNAAGMQIPMDYSIMPMCVYSFPEAASVGLTAEGAESRGITAVSGRSYFAGLGRAQAYGEPEGFIKLVADGKTGLLLGAQILGYNASEMIGIISVAIKGGLTVKELSETIQPHPTFSEGIQEAALNLRRQLK